MHVRVHLTLQSEEHRVAPLDTFATAGREGIAAMLMCYRHTLTQHTSLWPYLSMATQQSTPWNATTSSWRTFGSIAGMGEAGGLVFQGDLVLAMTGSTHMDGITSMPSRPDFEQTEGWEEL